MTTVHIRALLPADALAYAALRHEMLLDSPWAFAGSIPEDLGLDVDGVAKRLTDAGYAIVGAFSSHGSLMGAAGLVRERHAKCAHRAKVWGVYVTPGARGTGLAKRVMRVAIEIARGWPGVTNIGLSCSERAHAAKRVYESLGFVEWGREPAALSVEGRRYDEHHLALIL